MSEPRDEKSHDESEASREETRSEKEESLESKQEPEADEPVASQKRSGTNPDDEVKAEILDLEKRPPRKPFWRFISAPEAAKTGSGPAHKA